MPSKPYHDTEELTEKIHQLWMTGATQLDIALDLNLASTGVVSGIIGRARAKGQGDKFPSRTQRAKPPPPRRQSPPKKGSISAVGKSVKKKQKRLTIARAVWAGPPGPRPEPRAPIIHGQVEGSSPVSLLAHRSEQCCWPLEDPQRGPAMLVCGAPVELNRPYCKGHMTLAYTKHISYGYEQPRA